MMTMVRKCGLDSTFQLVAVVIAACCGFGCADDADHAEDALAVRVANSIEAAEIRRWQFDSEALRLQYDELIEVLESATEDTLATPEVMIAFVSPFAREGSAVLYVHWIASDVMGDGIRILGGSESMDLTIPEKQLAWNAEDAKQVVIFGAEFWMEHDSAEWQKLSSILSDGDARVLFMSAQVPVSEPHEIVVVE